MQRKVIGISVVAGVLALVGAGLCMAQPPQGGQGGPGGPGGFGGFAPAQMRQRMMEGWKQQLGAEDDAWKVSEPRLTKVMELNRQTMMGGRGMFGMFGPRGMRSQRGDRGGQQGQQGQRQGDRPRFPGEENREPTAVEKAQDTLETTLENESASADTIKEQLTTLRAARVKAQQELAAAQQDLRQILTLRQEAVLVLSGMLN